MIIVDEIGAYAHIHALAARPWLGLVQIELPALHQNERIADAEVSLVNFFGIRQDGNEERCGDTERSFR